MIVPNDPIGDRLTKVIHLIIGDDKLHDLAIFIDDFYLMVI